MEKASLFNKWCWKNCEATCKRIKVDYHLSPCTKINLEWVKYLNIRSETVNYTEENMGTKLMGLGLREDFMNVTPTAKKLRQN